MGQGAGHLRVNCLHNDVCRHDHVHAAIDCGFEWLQMLVEGLAIVGNGGQAVVGIH